MKITTYICIDSCLISTEFLYQRSKFFPELIYNRFQTSHILQQHQNSENKNLICKFNFHWLNPDTAIFQCFCRACFSFFGLFWLFGRIGAGVCWLVARRNPATSSWTSPDCRWTHRSPRAWPYAASAPGACPCSEWQRSCRFAAKCEISKSLWNPSGSASTASKTWNSKPCSLFIFCWSYSPATPTNKPSDSDH